MKQLEANQTDIRENTQQKKAAMIDAEIPSEERASPGRGNTGSLEKKDWAQTHHRCL